MKIAIISAQIFDSSVGGVENHIRFIGKELLKKGHELRLFKPTWEKENEGKIKEIDGLKIEFVYLGKRPYDLRNLTGKKIGVYLAGFLNKASYSFSSAQLVQAVDTWNPELVWQHDFSSSWRATRKLSKKYPVVLTNHTGEYLMLQNRLVGRWLLPWILKHYSAVIGPSKELTPAFFSSSHTIHNGVDTSLFFPLSPEEKKNLRNDLYNENKSKFIVFCPRRWAPTKGVIFLAQAIREISRTPDLKNKFLFVFAGSDYDVYPKYASEINETLKGSESIVLKLGNVDVYRMISYYQSADLVIIPSLMEAVSLSALESMACKTPVLSTNVGGMPEIIKEGETGYLIHPANSDEIKNSLIAIEKGSERAKISENAEKMVKEKYSWQAIANLTEKVLMSAVNALH
ncbi:MAG: glycosyltransferase family 4 protein [bacterium]